MFRWVPGLQAVLSYRRQWLPGVVVRYLGHPSRADQFDDFLGEPHGMHLLHDLLGGAGALPGELSSLLLDPFRSAQESDDGLLAFGWLCRNSLCRNSLSSLTPGASPQRQVLTYQRAGRAQDDPSQRQHSRAHGSPAHDYDDPSCYGFQPASNAFGTGPAHTLGPAIDPVRCSVNSCNLSFELGSIIRSPGNSRSRRSGLVGVRSDLRVEGRRSGIMRVRELLARQEFSSD